MMMATIEKVAFGFPYQPGPAGKKQKFPPRGGSGFHGEETTDRPEGRPAPETADRLKMEPGCPPPAIRQPTDSDCGQVIPVVSREGDTMPNFGWTEILLIIVVVLLLFGARKLPDLARAIGRSLSEFKKGRAEGDQPGEKPKDQ